MLRIVSSTNNLFIVACVCTFEAILTVSLTAQTPDDGELNLPNGFCAGDDDTNDGVVP